MATQPPAYRRHQTGQATVRIKGKDYYLGKYGSERNQERYRELIAELWERRRKQAREWPTIEELMTSYLLHTSQYYRDSNENDHIVYAMRPLRRLYGDLATNVFTPKMLKDVQMQMVTDRLTRQDVNKRITRLRRVFTWGIAEEHVPLSTLEALRTDAPLNRGRTDAGRDVSDGRQAIRGHKPTTNSQRSQKHWRTGASLPRRQLSEVDASDATYGKTEPPASHRRSGSSTIPLAVLN